MVGVSTFAGGAAKFVAFAFTLSIIVCWSAILCGA
jgi:hypothetical protein